jgi:hypothetical protein
MCSKILAVASILLAAGLMAVQEEGTDLCLVINEQPMGGEPQLVEICPEGDGRIPLLVEVDRQSRMTGSGKADSQVQGDRGSSRTRPSH